MNGWRPNDAAVMGVLTTTNGSDFSVGRSRSLGSQPASHFHGNREGRMKDHGSGLIHACMLFFSWEGKILHDEVCSLSVFIGLLRTKSNDV